MPAWRILRLPCKDWAPARSPCTEAKREARYLPAVAAGNWIAAFALSEPEAGSDVAAMTTTARLEGGDYVLDGTKTWISNGGIADFYTVVARTGEAPGPKG